jgi:D-glycero-alpha-D-manno-heptose-7-phosphate kinase
MSGSVITASAPARVDLAGGTLDLWPLHVLHPGSVTVNVAIDRFAHCRIRSFERGFHVLLPDSSFETRSLRASDLFAEPRTSMVAALLEAFEVDEPLEIALWTEVPFGSGLGGSSALAVVLAGALERWTGRDTDDFDRVGFVRDVETRVLVKPAGVQDYYPPREGGAHVLSFSAGRMRAERWDVEAESWSRHLTLFDSGRSHSSGMNNWEVYRARLEGGGEVARHLDQIRDAAREMADGLRKEDFPAMGSALAREWAARRLLAPVVSTPTIERAIAAALSAGAWGGKACGAGGGGCVVFLSAAERTEDVRRALAHLGEGEVLPVNVVNRGLQVEAGHESVRQR